MSAEWPGHLCLPPQITIRRWKWQLKSVGGDHAVTQPAARRSVTTKVHDWLNCCRRLFNLLLRLPRRALWHFKWLGEWLPSRRHADIRYAKWYNIEHSVRWTYSRRTVISIIQRNVITSLAIQCCATSKDHPGSVFIDIPISAPVRDFSNSTPQICWTQLRQCLPGGAGHLEGLDDKPY